MTCLLGKHVLFCPGPQSFLAFTTTFKPTKLQLWKISKGPKCIKKPTTNHVLLGYFSTGTIQKMRNFS